MRPAPTDEPFVHAGRAGDPDLRWLAGAPLPPEPCCYVCVDDDPRLFAPPDADVAVPGVERRSDPTAALAEALPAGRVRAPRHLPHDAALRVERAGCTLRSTTAVEDGRARKNDDERAALRAAAAAADAGVERAREVLGGGSLDERADGSDAGARLRRAVAGAVAEADATPRVRVDGPPAPGGPVVVDAGARADGYHARTCRTLVAGGDGGAARRAHVACESALRVAAGEATPGTDVGWLASEVRAELASFGVEPAEAALVAGTGLARREAPRVGSGAALEAGNALVVAPAAQVPEADSVVRLADTLVVGEATERLTTAATASRP